jgi:fermentation-respiration switch protein FrsA (DUF1100 family)
MQNRYATIDRISSYKGPLIVAHGKEDEVIGPEHGRELFRAANEPKCFLEVPTSRHMEFPPKDYYRMVGRFFESLESSR